LLVQKAVVFNPEHFRSRTKWRMLCAWCKREKRKFRGAELQPIELGGPQQTGRRRTPTEHVPSRSFVVSGGQGDAGGAVFYHGSARRLGLVGTKVRSSYFDEISKTRPSRTATPALASSGLHADGRVHALRQEFPGNGNRSSWGQLECCWSISGPRRRVIGTCSACLGWGAHRRSCREHGLSGPPALRTAPGWGKCQSSQPSQFLRPTVGLHERLTWRRSWRELSGLKTS